MRGGADMNRCVVIGGGIAGLTAAAYLARAGRAVTLFEQGDQVGGFVASYVRDGFTFDVGARAAENSGSLFPMLRDLGMTGQVDFLPNPYGLGIEGKSFSVAGETGIGAFYDETGRFFPGEKEAVEKIKAAAYRASSLMSGLFELDNPIFASSVKTAMMSIPYIGANMRVFRETGNPRKGMGREVREYLRGITDNQDLVNLVTQPYFEGSTAAFALGYGRLFSDYYYPRGGMGALTGAIARYITDRGGTIRTGAPVSRILVEKGRVSGVGLRDGGEYGASAVIAAGDARRLFLDLLPAGSIPDAAAEDYRRGKPCESVFSLFLGVERESDTYAKTGIPHLIYAPDHRGAEPELMNSSVDYYERASMEISFPCLRDRSLAPVGHTGIIVSVPARYEAFDHWAGGKGPGYEALKKRIADVLVKNLERLYPGTEERIRFMETASPFTMERYTGNSGGSFSGWSHEDPDSPAERSFLRLPKAVEGPVEGLFRAGQWLFTPTGLPVSLMTGKLAALKAAAYLGRHRSP